MSFAQSDSESSDDLFDGCCSASCARSASDAHGNQHSHVPRSATSLAPKQTNSVYQASRSPDGRFVDRFVYAIPMNAGSVAKADAHLAYSRSSTPYASAGAGSGPAMALRQSQHGGKYTAMDSAGRS